jgi:BirA family transcriptional regulator, biotin operon repressor / biotin---[acetyl-CoA-carboxylase] ligase
MKTFLEFCIYHYKEIFSTSTEALELIDIGAVSNETVIIADKQLQGRGHSGKSWISPKGNFYASLIINQADKWGELVFVAAITVGSTLLSLATDLDIQYKWPNDILIGGKKISGILLEKRSNSNWLVIGIGINIINAPLEESTCISNYCQSVSNIDLLKKIIVNFSHLRKDWLTNGFYNIKKTWLERAFKLNKQISIKSANHLLEGVFTGIDTDGRLILMQKNNNLIYLNTGEVFL